MRNGEVVCVDLDGTLVRTDLFFECVIAAIKKRPWVALMAPVWLMMGRATLKERLARITQPDPALLPYAPGVIAHIAATRRNGQSVWLVTASHRRLADLVQGHLQLFDRVLATEDGRNFDGPTRARELSAQTGPEGFAYIGNSMADIPVWRAARIAMTANASTRVNKAAARLGIPHQNLTADEPPRDVLKTWLKAIRIHQWMKNLLIFVPIVTAHQVFLVDRLAAGALAFIAFGLVASATYLINDLMDLESDRAHARKRRRALASGAISIPSALVAAMAMLTLGLVVAWQLPPAYIAALAIYTVTTLLYSFWLKRVASLDVVLLAGLYTLRVIAGSLATGIELSFWLLAFSIFLFLCLALAKRVAELVELSRKVAADSSSGSVIRGRQYGVEDIQVLLIMGTVSGYIAVLVLALYIHSPEVTVLYRTPEILWLVAPAMLLWVTRLWVVTSRGYMHEDPVLFAIKDPETWATTAFAGAVLTAATLISL